MGRTNHYKSIGQSSSFLLAEPSHDPVPKVPHLEDPIRSEDLVSEALLVPVLPALELVVDPLAEERYVRVDPRSLVPTGVTRSSGMLMIQRA